MAADSPRPPLVEPRSFGLTFAPPSITLVYALDSKLRKRTMPVRGLRPDSDAKAVAHDLAERHPTLLAPTVVSHSQVARLVARLIEHLQARRPTESHGASGSSGEHSAEPLSQRGVRAIPRGGEPSVEGIEPSLRGVEPSRRQGAESEGQRDEPSPRAAEPWMWLGAQTLPRGAEPAGNGAQASLRPRSCPASATALQEGRALHDGREGREGRILQQGRVLHDGRALQEGWAFRSTQPLQALNGSRMGRAPPPVSPRTAPATAAATRPAAPPLAARGVSSPPLLPPRAAAPGPLPLSSRAAAAAAPPPLAPRAAAASPPPLTSFAVAPPAAGETRPMAFELSGSDVSEIDSLPDLPDASPVGVLGIEGGGRERSGGWGQGEDLPDASPVGVPDREGGGREGVVYGRRGEVAGGGRGDGGGEVNGGGGRTSNGADLPPDLREGLNGGERGDSVPIAELPEDVNRVSEGGLLRGGGVARHGAPLITSLREVIPLPADLPEDLNRVSEEELRRAKDVMNTSFEANALKPGNPGYVHDKAVDFDGDKEANEWDDELSDVSELSQDEFTKEMALLAQGM